MDTSQIIAGINQITSVDDLRTINHAVIEQIRTLSRRAANTFHVGQSVEFTSRLGDEVYGVVTKINSKTLKVKVGPMTWTVSAAMLRPKAA